MSSTIHPSVSSPSRWLCHSKKTVLGLELACRNRSVAWIRNLLLELLLVGAAASGHTQGLVNFMNTASTLVSIWTPAGDGTISGPPGSYYFALLIAYPGTTDPGMFAFTGVYATNSPAAGRISGGNNIPVPNWPPGMQRSFLVVGWPASMGATFNPAWLSTVPTEFAISSIGTGAAGGFDPQSGQTIPTLPIFGSTSISVGFNFAICLSCEAPRIVVQPQDQFILEDTSAQFIVGAMLTPSLAFQWFSNGIPISGATNSVLQLNNVAFSQNGTTYYVMVHNPWGVAMSSTVTLNVRPSQALDVLSVPGISIVGDPGTTLDVVQCDALGNSVSWSKLETLALTNAQQWCFDLSGGSQSQRFYSTVQSSTSFIRPALQLHMVPSVTLTGTIGTKVQLQYINQFGATNVWLPLATVSLTNSSQLYIDASAIGQPPRFYRIVPQ